MLLAGDAHVSGYKFPLTAEDERRARKLERALKALAGSRELSPEDEEVDDRREIDDEDEIEGEVNEDEADEMYELDDDTDSDDDGDEEEEESHDSSECGGERRERSKYEDSALRAFHDFFKHFLLVTTDLPTDEDIKWTNVLECLMAIYALQEDGNFRQPSSVSQMFATLHYHIRGAIVHEATRMKESNPTKYPRLILYVFSSFSPVYEPSNCYCRAVEELCRKNFDPHSHSPFNIVEDYQMVATGLAKSGSNSPPTTIVHEGGKLIDYKGHCLSVPVWQTALQGLSRALKERIDAFCYNTDFSLRIPDSVPDDWTETKRGYSWIHNAEFLPNPDALLRAKMVDPKLQLASLRETEDGNVLDLNAGAMWQIMDECAKINRDLACLAFFTAGSTPRITEFISHKHTNSTRARTVFRSQQDLWLVTRRSKTETLTKKETFLPMKCHPCLAECLEKYLLLIRPLEMHLALQLGGQEAYLLYSEYLWMTKCKRTTPEQIYGFIRDFLRDGCKTSAGVREYRQIAVEIARIHLGPRVQVRSDELLDIVARQRGHSPEVARRHYAIEADHLPGMSSDLLEQFGRASEAWWEVTGLSKRRRLHFLRLSAGGGKNVDLLHIEQQLRDLMSPQLIILLLSLIVQVLNRGM